MEFVRNAAAAAVMCAVAGTPAAQSSDRVEVIGSRLRATDTEGTSPVLIITTEEIRRSGAGSLQEALGKLVVNSVTTSDLGGNGSFAAGSSSAGLRFLGKQSTLVLLNFRRVAPYPLADYNEVFTNLDSLPFDAIERVEVLRSGGSAMYGSDAVAGVINIVTRRNFSGVRVKASHQRSLKSGEFGSSTASVTAGFGSDSGPSLLANFEFYQREGLMWRDVMQHADPVLTSRSPGYGTLSSFSWPGNVIGAGPVPGCASELLIGGLCRYDRYARFEVIPASQRANLLLSGHLPLAGGRRAFSELLVGNTRTTYRSPFQPYGTALGSITWGNPNDNSSQTFQYRGLPAGHPLNPTGRDDAEFRYRFIDGPHESTASTLQYRALAGLAGDSRGWAWEAAAGLMGGRTRLDQQGWYSASGFRELIGNDDPSQVDPQFFNRGYRIGQTNGANVLNRLFPRYGYRGHSQQVFVDAKADGEFGAIGGRPLRLAVGAELRHERFTVDPSAALRAGDIVGNGLSASDAARSAAATFGELALPLTGALEAQIAARVDKYGGAAAHLSPKIGLRYAAHPALTLRGTVETGFRAPNLTESAASTKFAFDTGVPDPRRCPQAQALARDLSSAAAALPATDPNRALLQARADNLIGSECAASLASIVRHNPALRPETSRSVSLGLVFSPGQRSSVALDTWFIERRDEIGLKGTRDLLATEGVLPPGTISRAPLAGDRNFSAAEQAQYGVTTGALVATVGRFENTLRTATGGIDLSAKATVDTPLGAVALFTDATYLAAFRVYSAARNGWGDNLAGRSGYSRWIAITGARMSTGVLNHTLRGISNSGTPLRGDFYDTTYTPEACAQAGYSPGDCRSPGQTFWDYTLEFTGLKDLTVGMHLYNVFGKRLPVAAAAWLNNGGILPPTAEDAKGRMMRLTLEWKLR